MWNWRRIEGGGDEDGEESSFGLGSGGRDDVGFGRHRGVSDGEELAGSAGRGWIERAVRGPVGFEGDL
jgi:hypothetical protein